MAGQGPLGGGGAKNAAVEEAAAGEGSERPAPPLPPAVLGWVAPGSTAAELLVDFPGSASGPVRARAIALVDEAAVARAIATRQPAALVFENGDPRLPILLGLLQEPASPLQALLRRKNDAAPAPEAPARAQAPVEARVDGKRVVITGEKEVTLQCGEASLTLRRDGKILLKGNYVETYARGTNRVKGAQVKIN
jgi:hypothetical protein